MENTNIIHVRLREPNEGPEDYYFGSLAAIYDVLSDKELGLNYNTLRSTFAKRGYVYENPKCIIKRGTIHRKRQRD